MTAIGAPKLANDAKHPSIRTHRILFSVRWEAHMTLRVCSLVLVFLVAFPQLALSQSGGAKGLEPLRRDEYLRLEVAPLPVSGDLPDSATLEARFPSARDQGQMPACTAWATSYAKAYRIYMANGGIGIPDDQVQSPAFIYSALTGVKCNRGTTITNALRFLKTVGSVSWRDLPYSDQECSDWRSVKDLAKNNSFRGYRLNERPDIALQQIRNQIVAGNPVIVAINACAEFDKPIDGMISEIGGDESCGAHAVLAVGYDDRPDRKAIRIFNSWGDDWGDKGKVWMSYAVFQRRFLEAYIDFGPGEVVSDDLSWLDELPVASKAMSGVPTITPEVLKQALRSNIGQEVLGQVVVGDKPQNVSRWAIWLNLPPEHASQLRSVDYYFVHPTFRNPKHSEPKSNVFLAEWKGYGCVNSAYLVAFLKAGSSIRTDFDFCALVTETSGANPPD